MRFEYLTQEHERSLVSLLSDRSLSIVFNLLWLLVLILVLFWPKRELFQYMQQQSYPFVFLGTFVSALLMISYLNLRWGAAEFFHTDYFSLMTRKTLTSFEEETRFFGYALIGFVIHVGMQLLLCVPILIASAGIAGISFSGLLKAFSILFASAMVCRVTGFFLHLLFGTRLWLKYHFARFFFIFFLFASGILAPFANPIAMIYALHTDERILSTLPLGPYPLHMVTAMGWTLCLSIVIHFLIDHRIRASRTS